MAVAVEDGGEGAGMVKLTKLTQGIINSKNIATGCIAFTPLGSEVIGYIDIVHEPRRPRVTNCKNCGAPVHNNICEYCGTEY